MSEELKPCPFYGGKASFHTIASGCGCTDREIDFDIECTKCGVRSPRTHNMTFILGENGDMEFLTDERKIAIEQWNRRANDGTD